MLVDREIRFRSHRLFFVMSAAASALAAGSERALPIADLIEARAKPLFETLKQTSGTSAPDISFCWVSRSEGLERVRIPNGATHLFGLRLRLDSPEIRAGEVLQLWSDQFFHLLPGEQRECTVQVITRDGVPLSRLSLIAQVMSAGAVRQYSIGQPETRQAPAVAGAVQPRRARFGCGNRLFGPVSLLGLAAACVS